MDFSSMVGAQKYGYSPNSGFGFGNNMMGQPPGGGFSGGGGGFTGFSSPTGRPSGGGGNKSGGSGRKWKVKDPDSDFYEARHEKGRGRTALKMNTRRARSVGRPAIETYGEYYQPSFRQSYEAAQRMGQLPHMRGAYAGQQQRMRNRFSRMGMGQSGAAMAAQRDLGRRYYQDVSDAEMRANAQRQQAFSNLANMSYGHGMGALQQELSARNRYANASLSKERQAAQQEAQQAAGLGSMVSGLAQTGLGVATGNPMLIAGGVGSMAGGAGGGGAGGGGGMSQYNRDFIDTWSGSFSNPSQWGAIARSYGDPIMR